MSNYGVVHKVLLSERWQLLADELLTLYINNPPVKGVLFTISVHGYLKHLKNLSGLWTHELDKLFYLILQSVPWEGTVEDCEYNWGILIEVCLKRADFFKNKEKKEPMYVFTYKKTFPSNFALGGSLNSEEDLF